MEGEILGSRYQIIEYIAKGGFGKTYLAIDTQIPGKDKCVVKQLYPSVDDSHFLEVARRLFKTEAETLHSLGSHDQIPHLLAYFEEQEKFYLVQQYIEGHTLTKELTPDKLWTETQVIELLVDCLNILNFIHNKGVIHRDVKPDNLIRRNSDNKLVLVDFGTVKEVITEQTQLLPSTVAVGTKGYMPTEQARGKPRFVSDIYALGVIAIQALTGTSPLMLAEDDEGEFVWQSKTNIDSQLTAIINKMTRYHFNNRYQSAKEVLESLSALNHHPATPTTTPVVNYTPTVQINASELTNHPPNVADAATSVPIQAQTKINTNSNSISTHNPSNSTSNKLPFAVAENTQVKNNSAATVTKPKNSNNNKKLVSLGAALAVGIISAGGMYWLKNNNQKNVSNNIKQQVTEFEQMVASKQYADCYDKAIKIKQEKETIRVLPEAERSKYEVQCGLGKAGELAQSLNYLEALAIAKSLPKQTQIEGELSKAIDSWSQQALQQASELYRSEGKLKEALAVVKEIPQDSPVKQEALDETETWKTEFETNKAIIATAQSALNEEKWDQAQQEASKINSSSSDYWQLQAQNISKAAKEKIAAAQKPANVTQSNTDGSQPSVQVKQAPERIPSAPVLQTKPVDQGEGFGDRFNDSPSNTPIQPEVPQFRDDL